MKEFSTAVKQEVLEGDETHEEKPWPFKLDGKEYGIYQPTPEQFAVFVANTSRHTSDRQQLAAVIDLFFGMLDDKSHVALYDRLTDRSDSFDHNKVEEIIEWLVEEWSGKDSGSASGSTPSPNNTGTSSSAPTPAST